MKNNQITSVFYFFKIVYKKFVNYLNTTSLEKFIVKLSFCILSIFTLSGCIVFKTVNYEITITNDIKGSTFVTIEDICSDAANEEELENDKDIVFNYAAKSNDFVKDLESEGKKIISRNLFVKDGKLNATVSYQFDDITEAESIQYDDPYYFITLSPEDSIISTNGEVFEYDEYKRIIWDKSMKKLQFKIFSEETNQSNIKSLAPYYKK